MLLLSVLVSLPRAGVVSLHIRADSMVGWAQNGGQVVCERGWAWVVFPPLEFEGSPLLWRLTMVRTDPRRVSDLQLAGEQGAGEGTSALSAQNLGATQLGRWYHLVVCSTTSYHGTFLHAASGKTYLVVPSKPLSSNRHTGVKRLQT